MGCVNTQFTMHTDTYHDNRLLSPTMARTTIRKGATANTPFFKTPILALPLATS